MRVLGIIPARYASSRFPAKPLIMIHGKTMIRRVYEQVQKATNIHEVLVATDDERIQNEVQSFGGKVMMTSSDHMNGTERCAEVAVHSKGSFDVIINIQGDEPFVDPEMLNQLATCFKDPKIEIATLCKEISDEALIANPSIIKVVKAQNGRALYFSRSAIPYRREQPEGLRLFKHIGLYAFRSELLPELAKLSPSILEKAESLEQLRWLDHGYQIHVLETHLEADSVDTPADLERLLLKYKS